ncbi:acyl carrier protein phosphodiesterase [Lunatibacter salilacus]|uniref:acyl carrier protein phosphodiesterase n=1 Tax=Lunatibacter salilacus TaxID=2483804 RepID=UPI00131B1E82|nr:ACP phosphodiesterase [Lunatibacter salilacus]
MNFLAHAFLSFDQPKILVGNFIGDFVKGNLEDQFEREIINGVRLHREIDRFTDFHPLVKESQLLLKPVFFRYSSVITDMFFDYFLAKNWSAYHDVPLENFSQEVYGMIEEYLPILPDKFKYAFSFMKKENWLVAYGTEPGIQRALTGISQRATFKSNLENATSHLMLHHDQFQRYFDNFFPDLIAFSKETLLKIQQEDDPK